MKKICTAIAVFLSVSLLLCSCDSDDVSSVRIADSASIYETIYLYSFKDAQIDEHFESTTSTEIPSSTGYVYSTEKLEVGDTIKVWQDFKFGESPTSSWTDDRTRGTDAIVDKIVDTFKIHIEEKSGTFVITYYSIEGAFYFSGTTVTNRDNLKEVEKHKIEISKERVIIEYDI